MSIKYGIFVLVQRSVTHMALKEVIVSMCDLGISQRNILPTGHIDRLVAH